MPAPIRLTTPKKRQREATRSAGLPVNERTRGGHLYIYCHYPASWYYTDAINAKTGERYGWLPRPSKLVAVPGVNGCIDPGKGRPMERQHMQPMLASAMAKGGLVIDPTDRRLGPYMEYDQYLDTTQGGKFFIEPGQECTITPDGRVHWNEEAQIDNARQFHLYLRESAGLVHPLIGEYVDAAVNLEREKLSRYIAAASVTPGLQWRVEKQEQLIERMIEDWERYNAATYGEPEPEPEPAPEPEVSAEIAEPSETGIKLRPRRGGDR